MIKANFAKYDNYKNSGVDWLGDIPEHWEINKISQSFEQIGSGTTPKSGSDIYYEAGTINWINTGDLNDGILYNCKKKVTSQALQDHSLNIYPVGSLVIAMYGATIGKVSILNIEGCTNQACCVLNRSKTLEIKFLFYWFISNRNFIISLSYGGGQPNISQEIIKNFRVFAPPLSEQKAIARYLDEKTELIDRKINLLTEKAERYKELKRSLINKTVTHGLDQSVPMKNSGIEWLGDIPEHWEVKRFKEIFRKTHTGWTPDTKKDDYFTGSNIWVTIGDMTDKFLNYSKNFLSDKAIEESNICLTPKGSLMFSFKLSIGKVAFAGCDLYTNEAIISIEKEKNIYLEYFFYTLPIFIVRNAKENIYGAKLLNQELIFNSSMLSIPLAEQKAIAHYLDEKTSKIDQIIETINNQIEKLQELRKTLINDIVTGKIKVIQ